MPYTIRKLSKGRYVVVNTKTGKRMSKKAKSLKEAGKHLKALRINVEDA